MKNIFCTILLICIFFLIPVFFSLNAQSAPAGNLVFNTTSVQATWIKPTKREDDSPLLAKDIGGYIIFVSCNDEAASEIDVTNGSALKAPITNLKAGDCWIAISVYDQQNVRSDQSEKVNITIQLANKPAKMIPPVIKLI